MPGEPGIPAAIAAFKGDDQAGTAGTPLRDSIVVKVTDSDGNPVSGQRIVFVLADEIPGALVTPDEAVTGSDGMAAARWVLGGTSGTQRVVARLVSEDAPGALEARFTASATLPPPDADRLELRTQPSSSPTAGAPFDRQPVIQIRDAEGHDIGRSAVPVTAAVASGDGTLTGTSTILTDSRGRAEFSDLRILGSSGTHVLIFAAAGYTSVISEPVDVRPSPPEQPQFAARDDEYTIIEGSHKVWKFDAPGVLSNDQAGNGSSVELVGDATTGSLTLRANGSFTYRPGPDYFGADAFTYRIRLGSAASNTATVRIIIRPVNDSPNFQLRRDPDQRVSGNAGAQTVENFAQGINLGPSNGSEDDQTATFIVTTDNDALFNAGPSISYPAGTLSYAPSGRTGRAKVTVRLKDDGGTENGGADTSGPQTFTLTVTSGD